MAQPFPTLRHSRAQDSSLPGSSAQSGSGEQDQLPTQTEEVAPEVGTPDTPDTPETPVVDDRLDVVRLISISKTPHLIFVDADFLVINQQNEEYQESLRIDMERVLHFW